MSSKWDGRLGQQLFLFMIVSDVVVFVELENIDEKWDRNKQMFRARGCCHLKSHGLSVGLSVGTQNMNFNASHKSY